MVNVRAILKYNSRFLFTGFVLIPLLAEGCISSSDRPPVANSVGRGVAGDNAAAQQELAQVQRLLERNEHSIAIPRLLQIMTKYPDTQAAVDAEYFLARTYQSINSYREAIDLYNEYLRLAPEGQYAQRSHDALAVLIEEYERNFWTAERLNNQIAALDEKLKSDPANIQWRLDMAGLLWKRGDYEQAGQVYADIIDEHPEYYDDSTIRGRIEKTPAGAYAVITPAEVQRRAIERQPLSIVNTSAFKSGEDLLTRTPTYYVVTGMAVNRSDSVLYGVQVLVTIYGFGNVVYDTNTVRLGRLNPGEMRAFSVRFFNFPSIHNIHRYDTVASFER
jgi:tetratricopeptide (TPR) repeat protein